MEVVYCRAFNDMIKEGLLTNTKEPLVTHKRFMQLMPSALPLEVHAGSNTHPHTVQTHTVCAAVKDVQGIFRHLLKRSSGVHARHQRLHRSRCRHPARLHGNTLPTTRIKQNPMQAHNTPTRTAQLHGRGGPAARAQAAGVLLGSLWWEAPQAWQCSRAGLAQGAA